MSKLPSYELEQTPWNMGDPLLVGLNATEWWMVFTQIKDEVCFVTNSGYSNHAMSRNWAGTVITPGADMYRIEAKEKVGISVFTRVEKIQ